MITGAVFKDCIISAANSIANFKEAVNVLNVFPVPDGDTGTNMSMTMAAAKRAVMPLADDVSADEVVDLAASAMLRGARGNSGVILSLIFRGMADGLNGCDEANSAILAAALDLGAVKAYKAVQNPMEGTILTVIKAAAAAAREHCRQETDPVETFEYAYRAATDALKKTPDMLHVLKKARVVDAGGQGLCYIFLGMLTVLREGTVVERSEPETAESAPISVFEGDVPDEEEIRFAYCTEFIVKRDAASAKNVDDLRSFLVSVGDSVVAVDDGDIIKIHVHTNAPGEVISKGQAYGELLTVKIENMRQQHRHAAWGVGDAPEKKKEERIRVAPEKAFGFVSVAAGEGFDRLFRELGADCVVSGGQTMNPSTEDILTAVYATPARTVFVLPNNKNIVLAADQAARLADDREIVVVKTLTVPQGVAAMLAFDADGTLQANLDAMNEALGRVTTVSVTYAARDSFVGGFNIKKGQCMGLEDGRMAAVEDDPNDAAFRAVKRAAKRSTEMITVYYGDSVTEEKAQQLVGRVSEKFDDAEVLAVFGGQPVYHYLISIE